MTGFENYAASTKEIELQIERKGVVLGIDWNNEAQVRKLAREALFPDSKRYQGSRLGAGRLQVDGQARSLWVGGNHAAHDGRKRLRWRRDPWWCRLESLCQSTVG